MKTLYRIFRSIIVTTVFSVVGLLLLLYIALSIPAVQNMIRERAEKELSAFLDTKVEIGELQFTPFNQAIVKELCVYDKEQRKALQVSRVGTGIAFWKLILENKLVFTHAELIGLRATIIQDRANEPLNIQFIIDAFQPKDRTSPPAKFDFRIGHVLIRESNITFDKLWKARMPKSHMDFNHLNINNLAADIALPRMSNDDFTIEVLRLRMHETAGLSLNKLRCLIHLTPKELNIRDLQIELPQTSVSIGDITFEAPAGDYRFDKALSSGRHRLTLEDARICPSDFSSLVPDMKRFSEVFSVNLDITGNTNEINISRLGISNPGSLLTLNLTGRLSNLQDPSRFRAEIPMLNLNIDGSQTARIVEMLANIQPMAANLLQRLGHLALKLNTSITSKKLSADIQLASALGNFLTHGSVEYPDKQHIFVKGEAQTQGFDIGTLLAVSDLGSVAVNGDCDIDITNGSLSGIVNANIPYVDYKQKRWQNIMAQASRSTDGLSINVDIDDSDAIMHVEADGIKSSAHLSLRMLADVTRLNMGAVPVHTPFGQSTVSGNIKIDVTGSDILDLDGELDIADFNIITPGKQPFTLEFLQIQSISNDAGDRTASIRSPYLNGSMKGHYSLVHMPAAIRNLLSPAFPSFIMPHPQVLPRGEYADLNLTIGRNDHLAEYLNLPIRLLEEVNIQAAFDETAGTLNANIDIPYILQGRDKLIRDSKISFTALRDSNLYSLTATTTMPSKSNEVTFNLGVNALNDSAFTQMGWKVHREGSFGGDIQLSTLLSKNPLTKATEVDMKVLPSEFDINDTTWHVSPATIRYSDKNLLIDGINIYSGDQFARINGRASTSDTDSLQISINDIDLDYLFSTLRINYVTFGGLATGRFYGTRLFSSSPVAYTDSLFVKGLTYNNGLLGDANIRSYYAPQEAKVAIMADIYESNHKAAIIDGGIWVKRDSLSFAMNADKVNIRFLQPFMEAFTSHVEGRASGNALLYGTFKDIDLKGKLFADTISMKLDFTNTVYSGSDSVTINPGYIQIPAFTLHDKFGNSARLQGWVRHHYFHEPSFEFNITNARQLLCYDTDISDNGIWYGTVYGNGGASIKGKPGIVNILVDMHTAPKSVFTFILTDTQEAGNYTFLTFSDRRKEEEEAMRPDSIPELRRKYMRMVQQQADNPSQYDMDLRVSVTPDAEMILVMDPVAGDKIKAYGSGALQMGYNSTDDRLSMYGRYTLDRGLYNFSLQDLILKTFTIRPGSTISFNGDPYSAQLNIDALYRVNTSLTDLDPSFATDRELNRTNVPVDAVLKVSGDMRQPDITFDIELPTLTEDMQRKVKSVVSTDDMMNRQIIYLLALNRFYTPEYMGGQGNNNEFTSIASSTLSSHLTNILGQLSPNWNFAPYLRSEQGDFSDLEVDLALSSRLFNNRLLLNGNFGYRDRSTSSTTFIGDFDLEYLLNRRGTIRLKAYNHFNDQNYYLKSALTTQGLGIMYKHDFNSWFTFLRRRKKQQKISPANQSNKIEVPLTDTDTLLRFNTK